MEYVARDVAVHYVEQGDGIPVLALHGAGVDHGEVMACLEPVFGAVTGYRRIYPDLPGMGLTHAPETIKSADDVLGVLLAFIDGVIGTQPLLVIGHSAGGYYAQAIADHRRDQVFGLSLLCPLLGGLHDVPEHEVVYRSENIGDAEFRDYFTVHTDRMLDRYRRYVEPAAALADESALARIGERWELRSPPAQAKGLPNRCPTLIVTGRQDSAVGYARAWKMLGHYPRATFAVLDGPVTRCPTSSPNCSARWSPNGSTGCRGTLLVRQGDCPPPGVPYLARLCLRCSWAAASERGRRPAKPTPGAPDR